MVSNKVFPDKHILSTVFIYEEDLGTASLLILSPCSKELRKSGNLAVDAVSYQLWQQHVITYEYQLNNI